MIACAKGQGIRLLRRSLRHKAQLQSRKRQGCLCVKRIQAGQHNKDKETSMLNTIAQWHEIVHSRDAQQLRALLHPDVVFQSPAVHTPQVGVDKAQMYLLAALEVLGKAQFEYVHEWRAEQSAVLEFTAQIDQIAINGVDLIHWGPDGRITRFAVMVRPLKALQLLVERMGAQLSAQR